MRILRRWRHGAGRFAELAWLQPSVPIWRTAVVDMTTRRIRRIRMIAPGHFMRDRFVRFDEPVTIHAPT